MVNSPFAFDRSLLDPTRRKVGISAFMRLRNEEEFVELAIRSHLPYFDEIVAVHNRCTDRTPEILGALQREYPHKLTAIHYEPHVYPQGSEKFQELPIDSVHSLANYCGFALSRTTRTIACKLDGDHVAIPNQWSRVVEGIRTEGLRTFLTFRGINLVRDAAGQVAVRRSRPFCGVGDIAFFPVAANMAFGKRGHYEVFRHTLPSASAGILFYHTRALKRDCGAGNYDFEENPNSVYAEFMRQFHAEPPPMLWEDFTAQNNLTDLPHPNTLGIQ